MAHNSRTRATLAAWQNPTAALTAAEIDKIDGYAFASINGDEGGVWAPATAIEIGGAGMIFAADVTFETTSDVVFDGDVALNNDVLLGTDPSDTVTVGAELIVNEPSHFFDDLTLEAAADLIVLGDASFANDVELGTDPTDTVTVGAELIVEQPSSFEDNLTIETTADLICNGDATFANDVLLGTDPSDDVIIGAQLTVEETATFQSDTTFEGLTFFADDADFQNLIAHGLTELRGTTELGSSSSDAVSVIGTMTLQTMLGFSGSGGVPMRTSTAFGNASANIAARQINAIYASSDNITDNRTWLIDDTDCVNGCFLWVRARAPDSNAHHLRIERPGGTAVWDLVGDGGQRHWVLLLRVGGSWQRFAQGDD